MRRGIGIGAGDVGEGNGEEERNGVVGGARKSRFGAWFEGFLGRGNTRE